MSRYAVCRFRKISDRKTLSLAYNHNYRTKDTYAKRADRDRKDRNEELIDIEGDRSYLKVLDRMIRKSDYYKNHKVRSNAVLAGELVLSYSKELDGTFDIDNWKNRNVEWLKKRFGERNVISAVYHDDERSIGGYASPHIHAVVLPFDDKGCLNMRSVIRTRDDFVRLQTEYALEMEVFGFERGEIRSERRHLSPKEYHSFFKESLEDFERDFPSIEPGEGSDSYNDRCMDYAKGKLVEKDKEIIRLHDEIDRQRTEIKNLNDNITLDDILYEDERKKRRRLMEDITSSRHYNELMNYLHLDGLDNISEEDLKRANQIASRGELLVKILDSYPDKEYARETLDRLNVMKRSFMKKEKGLELEVAR